MAKNIDYLGAIFPDVPSVKLPQQGGGLVAFDDTTDATATADKILQGYTAYANGQKLTGTASGGITPSGTISITQNGVVDVTQYASADVNVSGGGGASNFVTGTFTPQAETDGVNTISVPYAGTGYPILAVVEVEGGVRNPNVTDWYDLIQRYALGSWVAIRNNLSDFSSAQATVLDVHKSSATSATSFTSAQSTAGNVFANSAPTSSTSQVYKAITVSSPTEIKIYVNSTGAGLVPNITYRYFIVYSS